MKIIVVLLFALVAISSAISDEEEKAFQDYLKTYNIRLPRSGPTVEEKKKNFVNNRKLVEENNKNNQDYKLTINEFSLLSYDEFVATRTGLLPSEGVSNFSQPAPPSDRRGRAAAPASFDWTSTPGVVRAVQNQGSCGSCWAFAAVGAMEGALTIKYKRTDKLSEQEIIECARNPWTGVKLGCKGGWDFSAYDHSKNNNGITTQAIRPYRTNDGYPCTTTTARTPGSRVAIYYDIAQDEEVIKQTLFERGPLYVSFYVSSDFYSYRSGIYRDSRGFCTIQYNNHAVLLVGYGTEGGVKFWRLKNSWGPSWGEGGYFRLERGRKLCGIHKDASYVVLV